MTILFPCLYIGLFVLMKSSMWLLMYKTWIKLIIMDIVWKLACNRYSF